MKCSECDEKIDSCRRCGDGFEPDDIITCYRHLNKDMHFCNEECFADWLLEDISSDWVDAWAVGD